MSTEQTTAGSLSRRSRVVALAASIFLIAVAAFTAGPRTPASAADTHAGILLEMKANYQDAAAPPQFIPLAPGAVQPTGWLRDWAETAAAGITGQLGERHDTFRHGWTGRDFEAKGEAGRGLRWPLEQSAYWLDGLVRLAHILDDEELKKLAHARLDMVVDGVNDGGGETFIWWEPKAVLQVDGDELPLDKFTRNFNNWAHAHMGRALVAYYHATGDAEILEALTKVYADYPMPELAKDQFMPHGAATNLDPMLVTYAMSGDRRVLDNALRYARTDSFRQLTHAWATGPLPNGHTVLYYEHARVPAITYTWTGSAEALQASRRVLELGLRQHGLPVGLASGQEHLMGIGAIRGLETCNVPASAWTNKWMLQLTGERGYADQVEQVVLNAGPAAVSRDFDMVCYFQTMNRIDGVVPIHTIKNIEGYDYSKTAGKTLCCVANLTRMIPDYIQHMWMATMDGGLAATLYGPGRVQGFVADATPVTIETRTDYPFKPDIEMTLSMDAPSTFPLSFRTPGWCKDPSLRINDVTTTGTDENGFVRVERQWSSGDRVVLRLPASVEIRRGKTTQVPDTAYFRKPQRAIPITKVPHADRPFASVHYGPLVFALPMADETPNKAADGAKWNYALDMAAWKAGGQTEVIATEMPDSFRWQIDAPLKLKLPARQFGWNPGNTQPLPDGVIEGGEKATITLVPYGCTKFRVCMFPVAD